MSALQTLIDAGLTLRSDGERLIVTPASALTDPLRELIREHKPELLVSVRAAEVLTTIATLLPDTGSKVAEVATIAEDSEAWTDADITRFLARRDRLMRWGWTEPDAEALAGRLIRRDREGDDRVVCAAECQHFKPGRCGNHRAAGLNTPEVSGDLASLLQRCPGSDRREQFVGEAERWSAQ